MAGSLIFESKEQS